MWVAAFSSASYRHKGNEIHTGITRLMGIDLALTAISMLVAAVDVTDTTNSGNRHHGRVVRRRT